MKITFVGTGSGKTTLKRYHSSLLFSFNFYNLLVDAGDGVSRALMEADINYNSLNGILFSHLHPDHFSGLGALIVQMKMFNRTAPLEIYIHRDSVEDVKNYLLTCNLISEKMEFDILYRSFEDNQEFFVKEDFKILARENSHLSDLKNFNRYPKMSFYCASFLFSFENRNLMYTADIGAEKDLELFKDYQVDILISEITHISISDFLEKWDAIGSPLTYLTHITEESEAEIDKFLNNLPTTIGKIELADDCQIIEF